MRPARVVLWQQGRARAIRKWILITVVLAFSLGAAFWGFAVTKSATAITSQLFFAKAPFRKPCRVTNYD